MPTQTEFNVSKDLIPLARRILDFLNEVNKHPQLFEGNLVTEAIHRYEEQWLPLVAKYSAKKLIPPLEIRYVWYCHMLNPKAYERDCNTIFKRVLDNHISPSKADEKEGKHNGWDKWKILYKDIQFDLHLDGNWRDERIDVHKNTMLTYDLRAACKRQATFIYQVALPHFKDQNVLENALKKYEMFVQLWKRNPDLVPPVDVELMWQVHLTSPLDYAKTTNVCLGFILPHNESDGLYSTTGAAGALSKNLWMTAYKDNPEMGGCMYRGNTPVLNMHAETRASAMSAKRYNLTVKKVVLENVGVRNVVVTFCRQPRGTGGFTSGYRWVATETASKKLTWEPWKKFLFDTTKSYALYMRIEAVYGGCWNEQRDLIGFHEMPFSGSVQSPVTYELPLMKKEEGKVVQTGGNLVLEMKVVKIINWGEDDLPTTGGPLLLKIEPGDFLTLPENTEPSPWEMVPLPASTTGSNQNVSRDLLVAEHTMMNHEGRVVYGARIIHCPSRGTCAALILDDTKKVLAETHLIGPDQLPVSAQLNTAKQCVTINPSRNEKAMVITDNKGDWGVVVARWAVYKEGTIVSDKDNNSGNPGFMHVKFYNLRRLKVHTANVPYKKKDTGAFLFDFDVDDIYVDMTSGNLIVAEQTYDLPQNIALGFALNLLFTLCQPRPVEFMPTGSEMRKPPIFFQRKKTWDRKLTVDDLIFLDYVGYHYSPRYNAYWYTQIIQENISGATYEYMHTERPLVWDADVKSGNYGINTDCLDVDGGEETIDGVTFGDIEDKEG